MDIYVILGVLASCSVGVHLVIFHLFAGLYLIEQIQEREWFILLLLCIPGAGLIIADYMILKTVIAGVHAGGFIGLLYAAALIGPKSIELINSFIAEIISEIIFIGYVPGGKVGFFIGLVVSLALNGLEFAIGVEFMKEKYQGLKKRR